jgi:hypothetical protein
MNELTKLGSSAFSIRLYQRSRNSCLRHGSRRAGCITKGARPVRRAGVRNQRRRRRTALTLDPYVRHDGEEDEMSY